MLKPSRFMNTRCLFHQGVCHLAHCGNPIVGGGSNHCAYHLCGYYNLGIIPKDHNVAKKIFDKKKDANDYFKQFPKNMVVMHTYRTGGYVVYSILKRR
jgi:hypothetical protein